MNQTTWVIGGGVIIMALATVLYFASGDTPATISINNNVNNLASVESVDTGSSSISIKPMSTDEITNSTTKPENQAAAVVVTSANPKVTLHTSMGDITLKLYSKDAPKTVDNFIKLSSSGFYDGIKFHRVIKGFMNQAGDPNSKDDSNPDSWGMGGPGYKFADEINTNSDIYKKGYKHGVLAMANSGPNTNGSQFFIMAADYPLPPLYVIFGEVISGLDVVDSINNVKTDGSAQTGGNDRPLTPVVIKSVEL